MIPRLTNNILPILQIFLLFSPGTIYGFPSPAGPSDVDSQTPQVNAATNSTGSVEETLSVSSLPCRPVSFLSQDLPTRVLSSLSSINFLTPNNFNTSLIPLNANGGGEDDYKPPCTQIFQRDFAIYPQPARSWIIHLPSFKPNARHWIHLSSSLPRTESAVIQGRSLRSAEHTWHFGPRGQTRDESLQTWIANWSFETYESGHGGWVLVHPQEMDRRAWWRGEVGMYVES